MRITFSWSPQCYRSWACLNHRDIVNWHSALDDLILRILDKIQKSNSIDPPKTDSDGRTLPLLRHGVSHLPLLSTINRLARDVTVPLIGMIKLETASN